MIIGVLLLILQACETEREREGKGGGGGERVGGGFVDNEVYLWCFPFASFYCENTAFFGFVSC